jgi:hypothetical protein
MEMKRMKKIFFLVCVVMLQTATAQVDLNKVAQSTMNFQLVSISARAAGLGDAVFSTSIGSEAIFYNPAGLAESKKEYDVSFFHTGWIADINYNAGAIALNFHDFGTIGLSALWVDYGTINATSLIPKGEEGQYPLGYIDLGPMKNIGAYIFGLSYGRAINEQFSVGGTLRITGQNLGESLLADGLKQNNATKLVADIGVKYNTGYKKFGFGMAIRNFSSQITREKIEEQLPFTFTMGAVVDLLDIAMPAHDKGSSLMFSTDYVHSNNFSERANFGLEYIIMNTFALRGGYQSNRDLASWSMGVGINTAIENYDVRVSYSYSSSQYFSGVNRLSLGFGF